MTEPTRCTNMTSAGERRRRASGLTALGGAAIVAAGLMWRDASSVAYFVLFPFVFGAAIGLLQASHKTCVVLGLKGTEEVEGGGFRAVHDRAVRDQARRQAKLVLWKAIGVAAAVTLLAVVASGITIIM